MFDTNVFKRSVKNWVKMNPQGSDQDLLDFCEEQIPPAQFTSYQWIVEQTVSWYRHVLAQREMGTYADENDVA